MHPLLTARHWVFDLDGTLTVAAHDFQGMKADLGLPLDQPILESLETLDQDEQVQLRVRLAEIEREVASEARAAPGALELLEELSAIGADVGILTRNTRDNALITLEAAGLIHRFDEISIVGRDEAPPKPSPAGIALHLERWGAQSQRTVMVGDFEFDLVAGRRAGATTVYVDPSGAFPYRSLADFYFQSLDEVIHERRKTALAD